jgi:hypothetical protein
MGQLDSTAVQPPHHDALAPELARELRALGGRDGHLRRAVHRQVAVQVAFESKGLKPGNVCLTCQACI